MPDMSCFTDWESIIGADSALCNTILPIAVSDSFYLLTVCEGYSVDSLLGRLRPVARPLGGFLLTRMPAIATTPQQSRSEPLRFRFLKCDRIPSGMGVRTVT